MPEPTLRIATYNTEWFNTLFDEDGQLIDDQSWSSRYNITKARQTQALGQVFQALAADLVLVVEAPDLSRRRDGVLALETFANRFGLRARKAIAGFANHTQQELIALYNPDVITARHAPSTDGAPGFDTEFAIDLDTDANPDPVRWSKPPLELALETPIGPLRLIGVHAKSKAPHGATSRDEAIQIAIANRRKQLAQCIWLRRRVDAHLAQNTPLVVLGDFNDGPGLDKYEALFGRSGVEIVLGETPRLYDPHAAQALQSRLSATPTTARFFKRDSKRYLSALLDYIMVSPDLRARADGWRIWHPFDDPELYEDHELRAALLDASDHFPVTLDLA